MHVVFTFCKHNLLKLYNINRLLTWHIIFQKYLVKYGYLTKRCNRCLPTIVHGALKRAIMRFQEMAGICTTGNNNKQITRKYHNNRPQIDPRFSVKVV